MNAIDKGLVFLTCLGVGVLYPLYWHPGGEGDGFEVWVAGQPVMQASLDQPGTYHIQGELGESVVKVQDGKVAFVSAPCSNKQCILAGWLQRGGEQSHCLPNRVSLQVVSHDPIFDSVNF